jgi:hypothetical protein
MEGIAIHLSLDGREYKTRLAASDAVNERRLVQKSATAARNRDVELSTHLSFFRIFFCSPYWKE